MVDEVEKQMKGYKLQSYDVQRQIKGIETFEVGCVTLVGRTVNTVAGSSTLGIDTTRSRIG